MGFGREKTTYIYFAVAASVSLRPIDSIVRLIVAKAGIIVTVADDFYDMEGSLSELEVLTDAVKRYFPYIIYSICSLDNMMDDILIFYFILYGF